MRVDVDVVVVVVVVVEIAVVASCAEAWSVLGRVRWLPEGLPWALVLVLDIPMESVPTCIDPVRDIAALGLVSRQILVVVAVVDAAVDTVVVNVDVDVGVGVDVVDVDVDVVDVDGMAVVSWDSSWSMLAQPKQLQL